MNLRMIAATMAVTALTATPLWAETYNAASYLPPNNDTMKHGWLPFIERVRDRTAGEVDIKMFAGGALLGPRAIAQGVRDGVADVGYLVAHYHPSEFPYTGGLLMALAGLGSDPVPVTAAANELLFNCAPCQDEMSRNGLVFTGVSAVTPMAIIANQKIETKDDFSGLKLRTGGRFWDDFVNALGGTPVSLPGAEFYEALNRGVVDGVMTVPSSMSTYSLDDIAKFVLDARIGVTRSQLTFAFNDEAWNRMDEENRKIILEEATKSNLDIAWGYLQSGEAAFKQAREKGVVIERPAGDLADAIEAYNQQSIDHAIKQATEEFGIADAEAFVEVAQRLQDKWDTIWEETGNDIEAFKARALEEMTSTVDAATYGITD